MGDLDFLGGPVVKSVPANTKDMGLVPGPGRSHLPQSNLSPCIRTTEPTLQSLTVVTTEAHKP